MSSAYTIPKGASLRFFPVLLPDPVLRRQIEGVFAHHNCLREFCILSVKRGWLFSKKITTLCVVHDDANAFSEAQAELTKTLDAYFSQKSGFMDCMIFDWSITEQRNFVEALAANIPFTKKNPNKIR
jgi:hypothetical protein